MRDAKHLFAAYAQNPDVTRYLLWAPHESAEVTRYFLADVHYAWLEGIGHRPWVLVERDDPVAVPFGMLGVTVNRHSAEVGYVMSPTREGRGLMTEALSAVTEHALTDGGLERIWATCHPDNLRSQRVLERCGFMAEGRLRKHTVYPNLSDAPADSLLYARVTT